MPNLTYSPNFNIRTIPPDEWRANAVGPLALPPGFWEGPGANLQEARVTTFAAFLGERMLGYVGVREVTASTISPETRKALQQLMVTRRLPSVDSLSETAVAAIENPNTPDGQVVAFNREYGLVSERGQGVGTALGEATLNHISRYATPEEPMPVYLSVAEGNPAARLFVRQGFEPLTVDGRPLVREHPYYLPPDANGNFQPSVTVNHVLMGTVVEGRLA